MQVDIPTVPDRDPMGTDLKMNDCIVWLFQRSMILPIYPGRRYPRLPQNPTMKEIPSELLVKSPGIFHGYVGGILEKMLFDFFNPKHWGKDPI